MKTLKFHFIIILFAVALFTSCTVRNDKGVVINGVKWATRNVDKPNTFAAVAESTGMFYQWNIKTGWFSSDQIKNSNGGTEWDTVYSVGAKWIAANDPCPKGWRVPAFEEFDTLLDEEKVTYRWTTQNGVKGITFIDKISRNFLFLPAAGYRSYNDGTFSTFGSSGDYWSSTPTVEEFALNLFFDNGDASMYISYRKGGRSVRCVAK